MLVQESVAGLAEQLANMSVLQLAALLVGT